MVRFAFDDGKQRVAEVCRFDGDRDAVRRQAANYAVEMALRLLDF
jgi:nicotinamide mononucleotide (NMN) deamidase PncC